MPINEPRINNQITATELQVINEEGKNLGVMEKDEALRLSESKGLDLIEISPHVLPPIVKIVSYDKFRYQQEKKLKKQRASQQKQDLKQIQISVKEAQNDLEIKARRIKEFLDEGHIVEIMLVMRGREKGNRDWAMKKIYEFLKMLPEHKSLFEPRPGGRGIIAQIIKAK